MSQISGNTVIVPTLIAGNSGSLAFMPAGIPTASYQVTGSDLDAFIRATASFTIDALDNQFKITIPSGSSGQSSDIIPLFITSSGINPRVGIGTTTPQSAFDFKDITDSTKGTEFLLRSSKTTKGADVGDTAGSINFAIDSGSFTSLETTGSIGKIKGIVTSESINGVQGKITFELFKGVTSSDNAIEFGYGLGHTSNTYNAVFTSSIELKDRTSTGRSQFMMYDDTDALKFSVLNGNVTASGNISSSGTITLDDILYFTSPSNQIRTTDASGYLYINPDGNLYLGQDRTDHTYIGRQNNTNYTTRIFGGTSTVAIKVGDPYVELNVPVTASSDISASGDLTANTINGTINGGSF